MITVSLNSKTAKDLFIKDLNPNAKNADMGETALGPSIYDVRC